MSKYIVLLSLTLCCVGGMLLAQGWEKHYAVEITATHLNVRTGIGLSFHRICIIDKGTKLAVASEKMGWLEVILPLNAPCWISAKLVAVEANEKQGTIKSNRVNVRTSLRTRSSGNIIGQLSRGTSVTILASKDNWYKIVPPESLTGWVNKKYTKHWGNYEEYKEWAAQEQETRSTRRNREVELKEKFKQAESIYETESGKPYLEQDFAEALALYREIVEYSTNKNAVTKSKDRIRFIGPRQQILNKYREAIKQKDQKLEEIHEKYIKKIKDLLAEMTKKPAYVAQGWIDSMGKVFNRPGTHKLVKGGQVLFFLKSTTVEIDDYYKRFVGVRGQIIETPDWPQKTIIVDEITIIGTK